MGQGSEGRKPGEPVMWASQDGHSPHPAHLQSGWLTRGPLGRPEGRMG